MADISVIIPTRRRPESLTITLQSLAAADRSGINVEIIVVENDFESRSELTCQKFAPLLTLRYYLESRVGRSYALNRALDEGVLGRIVAVLDDDISVKANWYQGVIAITRRWPRKGYFTCRSQVQWPEEIVPSWCKTASLQGWAYSVSDEGLSDHEIPNYQWACGGFFWFRRDVLSGGRQFPNPNGASRMDLMAKFMLQLADEGLGGVAGRDTIVWHRVQRELLEVENLKVRAGRAGRAFADVRLCPFRQSNPKACQFRDHPILSRAYCLCHLLKSFITWWWIQSFGSAGQIGQGIHSLHLIAYYKELLRIAGQMPEYRVRFDRAVFKFLKKR